VEEGWTLLDAVHWTQAQQANDLAVRWNCKAGKCGSCSAEVNGKPRLMCMTRMNELPQDQPIAIEPMKRFPRIKDLVTDVSFNYRMNKTIPPFKPKPRNADGTYRMQQMDVDRIQEFHKCIECFLCQDVCHVMRDHKVEDFAGPRFFIRIASLAMHPLDTRNRLQDLKDAHGIGFCNITKCCTEVCPEHIHITDNAIIPLKERVAGAFYDPMAWLWRKVRGRLADQKHVF
jgi:succinate dehydrogenase / fumarate reductase iron-sulfur subunit